MMIMIMMSMKMAFTMMIVMINIFSSVGMDHGVYISLGLDSHITAWAFWKSSGPCCQRGKPNLQICEGMDETRELEMNSCGCRC